MTFRKLFKKCKLKVVFIIILLLLAIVFFKGGYLLLGTKTFNSLGEMATFGLFCFTIWQYIKISNEEQKNQERSQAKNVSAWIISNDGETAWFAILNESENPVYEVVLSLVSFQGAGASISSDVSDDYRTYLSVLPPGKYYAKTMCHRGMMFHAGAAIAFSDNSGISWVRECDGSLKKINQSPTMYYNLSLPLDWEYPLSQIS